MEPAGADPKRHPQAGVLAVKRVRSAKKSKAFSPAQLAAKATAVEENPLGFLGVAAW
jgi:hypothetical protein